MLVWQLLEGTSFFFFLTTTIVAVDIVAIASTGANAALRGLLLLVRVARARATIAKHSCYLHMMRRWRCVVAREVGLRYVVYGDLQEE